MIDVLQAVALELKKVYPNISRIDKNTEQGVKKPCFLISAIATELDEKLNGLAFYRNKVNIVYLQDKEDRRDRLEKEQKLYSILRTITVGDKQVGGINIRSVNKSNLDLNMLVEYNILVNLDRKEYVNMNNLEIKQES